MFASVGFGLRRFWLPWPAVPAAANQDQSPESPAYLDELRAALRRETGDRRKRRHDA